VLFHSDKVAPTLPAGRRPGVAVSSSS
jgi:hypothetical protein